MNRILILGSAGTGKSTLSLKLGNLLDLPVVHLDSIFWTPGWISISNEDFDRVLNELVEKEKWIMDGNYTRTIDLRLSKADTVIYLDYPTYLSLYRVIKRRIQYHGKSRPDLGGGCIEKIDLEFLLWILNFRRKNRKGIFQRLDKLDTDKRVYVFKSPKELNNFLNSLHKESLKS